LAVETSTGRKLFVGPRVRRLREQHGLSQTALSQRLALSLSYVSQIENNQRPVTAAVLLKLAEAFGGDVSQFSDDTDKRLLGELDCALQDRTLRTSPVPAPQLARMIEQAPELVDAFLLLYQRHQRMQEDYGQAIDRFYGEQGDEGRAALLAPLPHEEVRDQFNRRNNYIDRLDRLAEELAHEAGLKSGARMAPLKELMRGRCGIEVVVGDDARGRAGDDAALRRYEPTRRRLWVPAHLSDAQQAFQVITQYALVALRDAIDEEVREGGYADPATQGLARQGFAHYVAGAALLPYERMLGASREFRYDIERLQRHFHVGFETVCHRLSTLQRPGLRGVPFYFVRIDQAGNISKRQSATVFHFARHGGACPLWQVHEAFAQPGRILTQVAEMPDGARFFGIARTIERGGGGGFEARRKLFAIGLGCELSHARELVYADGLDVAAPRGVVPIGPGCRVCPRTDCVQRAFPPAGRTLVTDSDGESLVSYRFESD
jgi:predicted transcriptional regulator/transcriptional regulator with XRE-family HTH domain